MFSSNFNLFQHFRTARTLQLPNNRDLEDPKKSWRAPHDYQADWPNRAEHLAELRGQIAASAPSIVLELAEVTLVDADVARFLSACESEGIQLQHCSAYIREWIVREQESAIKA